VSVLEQAEEFTEESDGGHRDGVSRWRLGVLKADLRQLRPLTFSTSDEPRAALSAYMSRPLRVRTRRRLLGEFYIRRHELCTLDTTRLTWLSLSRRCCTSRPVNGSIVYKRPNT
jgi:hypothetical protein